MESALCSIYSIVVFVSEIERMRRRGEGEEFEVFFIYHTENVYFDYNSFESANVLGTNLG